MKGFIILLRKMDLVIIGSIVDIMGFGGVMNLFFIVV